MVPEVRTLVSHLLISSFRDMRACAFMAFERGSSSVGELMEGREALLFSPEGGAEGGRVEM